MNLLDKDWCSIITTPAKNCVRCNASLDSFATHRSALQSEPSAESENALRQDICPLCWEEMDAQEYFSFWLRRQEKKQTQPKMTREQIGGLVLSLFNALREAGDSKFNTHLFVLSHLLMKQKTFQWRQTRHRKNGSVLVFENIRDGERIEVSEVQLNDEALIETKREIDQLLATVPVSEVDPSNRRNIVDEELDDPQS